MNPFDDFDLACALGLYGLAGLGADTLETNLGLRSGIIFGFDHPIALSYFPDPA